MQSISEDHLTRAVLWILFGVAAGLALDLCAKTLLETYSLTQFILIRSLIAIGIMLAITPRFGGFATLRTERKAWHLLRSILAIGAMFGFFYGIANMPLIDALTLGYTAPLIMTALSAIVLGDAVGWRRWTAVVVGFGGVLLMLRPGSGSMSPAALAVLLGAFCYASQAITARKLGTTESTLALSFYVVVGPFIVACLLIDESTWQTPDIEGWALLTAAAAFSVAAWVGLVNGYRAVSPATLAPLEYLALVAGAIAGYLIWNEVPDGWVVTGATVIVASGLFVVYRSEQQQ